MDENSEKYSNLKVADLKRELKSKGLPTTGNKKELLERLGTTMDSDDGIDVAAADIISSETTDDADDGIESEAALLEEAALVEVSGTDLLHSTSIDIDNSLLEKDLIPPSSPPLTEEESPQEVEPTPPEPKKISLNRDSHVICNKENVEIEKPASDKKIITINKPASAAPIEKLQDRADRFGMKPTDMTEAQRKKLRAERFTAASISAAATNNESDPVEARQERFGAVTSPLSDAKKTFSSVSDSADDIIKKRRERFGVVTSSVVGGKRSATGENSDIKIKRAERFGGPVSSSTDDEKKKQRAMRFVSTT